MWPCEWELVAPSQAHCACVSVVHGLIVHAFPPHVSRCALWLVGRHTLARKETNTRHVGHGGGPSATHTGWCSRASGAIHHKNRAEIREILYKSNYEWVFAGTNLYINKYWLLTNIGFNCGPYIGHYIALSIGAFVGNGNSNGQSISGREAGSVPDPEDQVHVDTGNS